MEKITKHNYEAFFLDYTEGSLTENEKMDVLQFCENNPELKEELDFFINAPIVSLPSNSERLNDSLKKELKQELPLDLEEKFITYHEGELPIKDREQLLEDLQKNPIYQHDFDLYAKSRLQNTAGIIYPNKEQLKRKNKKVIWWTTISAAASLLLLFHLLSELKVVNTYQAHKKRSSYPINDRLLQLEEDIFKKETVVQKDDKIVVQPLKKQTLSSPIKKKERKAIHYAIKHIPILQAKEIESLPITLKTIEKRATIEFLAMDDYNPFDWETSDIKDQIIVKITHKKEGLIISKNKKNRKVKFKLGQFELAYNRSIRRK